MSIAMQPGATADSRPRLPLGLRILTTLLLVYVLVELYFLTNVVMNSAQFLSYPAQLLFEPALALRIVTPFVLLALTVVMIALVFAREPDAKPFGIVVCSLSIAFQLYLLSSIVHYIRYWSDYPSDLLADLFVLKAPSAAFVVLLALEIMFLVKWQPKLGLAAPRGAAPNIDSSPHGSYVARHWRGDISLGKSYWINGVLIALLWLVFWFAAVAGLATGVRNRDILVMCVVGMVIAEVSLYLWQGVGIWRSARKHEARGGQRFWANLVQAVIVLGVLYTAAALIRDISLTGQIAANPNSWLDAVTRRR